VRYFGFVDPSGGSGQDSMSVAVAHAEDRDVVLDAVREVPPPFSPETTVKDFGEFLRTHRITRVHGDRYAGEWLREQFRKYGISYEVSEKSKSDLYREVLPAINSGTVALLDHPRMVTQFCGLERRVARGGRDSIDHGPTGHDDVANAVTGAVLLAAESARVTTQLWMPHLNGQVQTRPGPDQHQLLSAYGTQVFEKPSGELTCATCQNFDAGKSWCTARQIGTRGEMPPCEVYHPRMKRSA
jgi:hypothetical protein